MTNDKMDTKTMREVSEKLTEIKDRLEKDFISLTDNAGHGCLRVMKDTLGADSEIGNSISKIGTIIMGARSKLNTNLSEIIGILDDRIGKARKYNNDFAELFAEIANDIFKIRFE